MADIIETKKIELKNPILIEGFPGVGMIGTAGVMYLVKELKMEMCGYIYSDKFPPFCTIHDGEPLPPARIYQSKKHNLLIFLSEFAIPLKEVFDVCGDILRWAKKKNVKTIYSLGGINIKVKEEDIDKVFGVATTKETQKLLEKNKVTIIKEGVTTGITGILLSKAYIEGFPVISLLTPSRRIGIDLMSSAAVLNVFSKIEKLPISTQKLIKEGMKIETAIKEVLERAKDAKQKYKKVEEYTPTYR